MADPYNLERFVRAQAPVFEQVVTELRSGCKSGHWMWFIFPQLRGLGSSPMAREFAISSLAEAQAYLQHPLLGPRLRQCTALVVAANRRSIADIFGYPDDVKFRSSMTLFLRAAPAERVFSEALAHYFGGTLDAATLERL